MKSNYIRTELGRTWTSIINIKDKDGAENKVQVRNALYVPDLATKLSVNKITRNGCEIKINNNGCKIYNDDKKISTVSGGHNDIFLINT